MQRLMCKGKIHRATVTEANLHYTGSITIDPLLMEAVNIVPYEIVQVTNVSNAARWKTYAIPGAKGMGDICLNGPPARLFVPGDQIIILSMGMFNERELRMLTPKVVFLDKHNRIEHVETHHIIDEEGEVNWGEL